MMTPKAHQPTNALQKSVTHDPIQTVSSFFENENYVNIVKYRLYAYILCKLNNKFRKKQRAKKKNF